MARNYLSSGQKKAADLRRKAQQKGWQKRMKYALLACQFCKLKRKKSKKKYFVAQRQPYAGLYTSVWLGVEISYPLFLWITMCMSGLKPVGNESGRGLATS